MIGALPELELEPELGLGLLPPPPALDDGVLELPHATTNPTTANASPVFKHLRRTLISSYPSPISPRRQAARLSCNRLQPQLTAGCSRCQPQTCAARVKPSHERILARPFAARDSCLHIGPIRGRALPRGNA